MTPEAWTFFSVLTTGVLGTFNEVRKTRKKVEASADASKDAATAAAEAALEAADLARPTGNGFAGDVRASFSEIKTLVGDLKIGQHELRQRLDQHIGDHASNDVRRH